MPWNLIPTSYVTNWEDAEIHLTEHAHCLKSRMSISNPIKEAMKIQFDKTFMLSNLSPNLIKTMGMTINAYWTMPMKILNYPYLWKKAYKSKFDSFPNSVTERKFIPVSYFSRRFKYVNNLPHGLKNVDIIFVGEFF